MKSIYILSTGRTGTKFLEQYLENNIKDSHVTHERMGSRFLNIIGNIAHSGLIPIKMIPFLTKFSLYRKCNCSKWDIDSNNMLWFSLSHTCLLKEDDVIIHVVRDPRTYVFSHLSIARFRIKSFIANYLLPFWQPNLLLSKKVSLKEFLSLSRTAKYAWYWKIKNEHIYETYKGSKHYYLLKYEDLFDEAKSIEIEEILGNIFNENISNFGDSITVKANKSKRSIDLESQAIIAKNCEEICSPFMKKMGYIV